MIVDSKILLLSIIAVVVLMLRHRFVAKQARGALCNSLTRSLSEGLSDLKAAND
jgi:hypothetical protein